MPEIRSALTAGYPAPGHYGMEGAFGVTLREVLTRDLVQVSAWPDKRSEVARILAEELSCPSPQNYRIATTSGSTTLFQLAPGRYWAVAPRSTATFERLCGAIDSDLGAVTELGHSRTFLRLSGPSAREVLARGFAIDLDAAAFPVGAFAQTVVHHIGVMIHRPSDDPGLYEIMVLRTYALSFWEWLFDTAQSFGCTLEAPQV